MESLLYKVTITQVHTKISIIKEHKDDDKIVECAVDSGFEYLISYNKHILNCRVEIRNLFNIKVLTPTEFLKLF